MERKWEAKLKRIEERASRYERKPLSSVYRPRLSKPEEPPSVWKLFPRQTQAFNFVKNCKEDVHVFALECKVDSGQRIYLVTTYVQLWFYYKSRRNLLHCYEVIPENAVCKLYFDLEFNKVANPEADGKIMVALLIEGSNFVRKILQPAFPLIASEDDDKIPETTGHGFSHFPETPIKQGTSFSKMSTDKDIGESWTLNSEKPGRLGSAEQSSPDLSFLVVKNTTGKKHLFVDLGVYTRNRNFRLYKSSKIGKIVALEVAEDNKFSLTQSNISKENQYFLYSLVSNVRNPRFLPVSSFAKRYKESKAHVKQTEAWDICLTPQVLPALDVLLTPVESWAEVSSRRTQQGALRILVDLKNEVWYQKCHDPVCKAQNFKSDRFPLPAEVCLLFLLKDEEEFTTDETTNNETKNPHKLSKGVFSDWDSGIDDTYFLEATEDAELAEAAANSLLNYNSGMDEIPDELIIEVL
ncbi:PREDICTED: DNA-directed primase/polymerase protein [Hipposideros armiger]|uniref:DNA-directed primase/polymerase protein n=1 Tax=Hipposideros armiger TaxID=186990 RepID=A0A8B7T9W1_HIPAR|nr:PREDICTED: DNA-directed primase/polymerase protein [Hipposideros armiger]